MTFQVRGRRAARAQGVWAIAARMLALVLALSLAAPGIGLSADMAFHAGGHHSRSEGPVLDTAAASPNVDPGLGEHLHCGCHQAARLDAADVAPRRFRAGHSLRSSRGRSPPSYPTGCPGLRARELTPPTGARPARRPASALGPSLRDT
ncbi:hypothetical protein M6G65_08870 [Methylobacterium tardum]|uniref:hypothetical protein n=1 Tax=Methylobacterium tardum TaxID=374432 RepID=UPI00201FCE7C|nr:hypothetical protein [Methylobacterium tardum]URD38523.1 hypothetical protein M6G65_08870 [Methylobacterium tardum]